MHTTLSNDTNPTSFTTHVSHQRETSSFIQYRPEFKRFFGSSNAALVFQQLEYWSSKYPQGFWKFFESCDRHPQYREGDSWHEELGFARRAFLRAFSLIGIRYKSKSAYLKESDPFQGKMYASYYDRKTNRTYFIRNHSCVKEFLISFWKSVKKIIKPPKKKENAGHYRNDPIGQSFTHAGNNNSYLHRSTSSCNSDDEPSSSPPDIPQSDSQEKEKEKDQNIKVAQNMLNLWNEITDNKQFLRTDLKTKLPQALEQSFKGNLELWEAFCLKVASSKFLMGEAHNSKFKAHLSWLIKPEIIQNIEDNYYSMGDRKVTYYRSSPKLQKTFNSDEIQGTNTWKKICEQLCNTLGYDTFSSWFINTKLLNEENIRPRLQCPTLFMRDWIDVHYRDHLEHAVKQILPHVKQVELSL